MAVRPGPMSSDHLPQPDADGDVAKCLRNLIERIFIGTITLVNQIGCEDGCEKASNLLGHRNCSPFREQFPCPQSSDAG